MELGILYKDYIIVLYELKFFLWFLLLDVFLLFV